MKSIKSAIIFTVAFIMAIPAFAGTNAETAFGVLAGAAAGRALCHNCNTRNQNIATGVAALAGGFAGNAYGDRSDRQERTQQQYANNDSVRSMNTRTVSTVNVSSSRPVIRSTEWVEEPLVGQPIAQPRYTRVEQSPNCDEQYYHGQYNPEAARAYCQGRRDRERQVREAYAEGLAGR